MLLTHCRICIGFCFWKFRFSYSLTWSVSLQDHYTTATDVNIAIQTMLEELQKLPQPLTQSLSRACFILYKFYTYILFYLFILYYAFTYLTDKSFLCICLPNCYFAQESVICIHHWNKGIAKPKHVNKDSRTWVFPDIPIVTHIRLNCSNSVTR